MMLVLMILILTSMNHSIVPTAGLDRIEHLKYTSIPSWMALALRVAPRAKFNCGATEKEKK